MKGSFVKRICILLCLLLTACNPTSTPQTPSNSVQSPLNEAQSAVLNLNIFNRDATLSSLSSESNALFLADVGNQESVAYIETIAEQSFIALSDNPAGTDDNSWSLQASPSIPISYVIDVTSGTLSATLTDLIVSRFDLVAETATIDVTLPTSELQMAVDATASTVNLHMPIGSQASSVQLTSTDGFITMTLEDGVNLIGNLSITSGGMTITVPTSTGVQILVENAENSEITLPNNPRSVAEASIYTTPNFDQTTAKVILTSTLIGATLRIIQE
ncbi:MAG: hypothetical protein AAFV93_20265 [Chloroflexota bacterium]